MLMALKDLMCFCHHAQNCCVPELSYQVIITGPSISWKLAIFSGHIISCQKGFVSCILSDSILKVECKAGWTTTFCSLSLLGVFVLWRNVKVHIRVDVMLLLYMYNVWGSTWRVGCFLSYMKSWGQRWLSQAKYHGPRSYCWSLSMHNGQCLHRF